jgi:hypothetical protein
MPGEAFGDSGEWLAMEAQPESGMVITDSGIIIIDPNADEAKFATTPISSGAQAVTADTSWALPNFARPTGAAAPSSDSEWDAVLTRARAQLSTPSGSTPPGKPRK